MQLIIEVFFFKSILCKIYTVIPLKKLFEKYRICIFFFFLIFRRKRFESSTFSYEHFNQLRFGNL